MSLKDKLIVKKIMVVSESNPIQVKTIKPKFTAQLNRWQYSDKLDMDWLEVIGYYKDMSSGIKTWNMVVFQYKKNLYQIEHLGFFQCLDFNMSKDDWKEEFNKFPQLFVD